jgi:hypothetical protein
MVVLGLFGMVSVGVSTVIKGEWTWWGRCLANAFLKLAKFAVPLRQREVRSREWHAELDYVRADLRLPGVLLSGGLVIAALRLRVADVIAWLAMARIRAADAFALTVFRTALLVGGNLHASLAPLPGWRALTERIVAALCFSLLTAPPFIHARLSRASYGGDPSRVASLVASLVFGSRVRWAFVTTLTFGAGLSLTLASLYAWNAPGALGASLASLCWTTTGLFLVGAATCWIVVARAHRLVIGAIEFLSLRPTRAERARLASHRRSRGKRRSSAQRKR